VSCGHHHTAVILADGSLYTFGAFDRGASALGHGEKEHQWTPKLVEALEGKSAVQVKCGCDYTLVLTKDGEVYAFGSDDYGQLGLGGGNRATSTSTPKLIRSLRTLSNSLESPGVLSLPQFAS